MVPAIRPRSKGRVPDPSSGALRGRRGSISSPLPEGDQPLSGTRISAAMNTATPCASSDTRHAISYPATCATRETGAISVGGICCLFSLALVVPSAVLLLMLHFTAPVVTSTGDAGTFQGAISSKDLTNVRTSLGTLSVTGGFSAPTGQALLLRYTNKHGLQLCPVGNLDACAEVAGPWAGRMQPVEYVHHWYTIDYARHGINPGSLPAILLLGIVTFLASLFAWVVEANRGSDATARKETEHAPNP